MTAEPANRSIAPAFILCALVWALMRCLFFTGIAGSDDLHYMRFAAAWDRPPANHWEARLLGNALTWLSMQVFGRNVIAAALPSLAASLAILLCTFHAAYRHAGRGVATWAGLLVALLPLDVYLGTTVSPFVIMTAFLTIGTVLILRAQPSTTTRVLAAVCFALGIVTHLSGVYYVSALAAAGLWVDRRRHAGTVAVTALAGAVAIALDMTVFHLAYGNVLGRFQACLADASDAIPIPPTTPEGGINPEFITRPLQTLMFSKAFGLALSFTLLLAGLAYRRLPRPLRIAWLTSILLWLWVSYGTQVPWAYAPFWRMSRFLHPLTPAVALLFAAIVSASRRNRAAGVVVLASCVVNLLSGGSWGQNVRISRELLDYARAHPDIRFLTDYHTLNEMHLLNGISSLPNVATTGDADRFRSIDPDAPFAWPADLPAFDAILVNPLNLTRASTFAGLVASSGGSTQYETSPAYRPICRLIPPLQRFGWSVRKPPARVVAFEHFGKRDAVAVSAAPAAATP